MYSIFCTVWATTWKQETTIPRDVLEHPATQTYDALRTVAVSDSGSKLAQKVGVQGRRRETCTRTGSIGQKLVAIMREKVHQRELRRHHGLSVYDDGSYHVAGREMPCKEVSCVLLCATDLADEVCNVIVGYHADLSNLLWVIIREGGKKAREMELTNVTPKSQWVDWRVLGDAASRASLEACAVSSTGHDLKDRRRGKYNGDKPTWGMCDLITFGINCGPMSAHLSPPMSQLTTQFPDGVLVSYLPPLVTKKAGPSFLQRYGIYLRTEQNGVPIK
ncbi:hypothetical protein B0H14DRAFT_2586556 [Mycena olivaceomarginata]|nr:hypothetical protein B0H14DRAFT_2586556 [Mycena olivaceomarginata]